MSGREHIVGRATEVAAVERHLAAGRGAVLVGAAGVGKSAVAEQLARVASAAGDHVVRVRATVGSSELPLGAFSAWLDRTERFLTPLVNEIRARLVEAADGRRTVLVVDDVDLLDDASGVLVHQLVSAGDAVVVATLRQGRLLPGELVDLYQRGEVAMVEIHPLGDRDLRALAESLVGAPLSEATHGRLAALTHGNPLFARVLLDGAGSPDDGGDLVLPTDSSALVELVGSRLVGLGESQRRALLHLAFAEPCGPGELASGGEAEALAALEAAGMVVSELDGNRLVLRVAHPLYGEVLRNSATHLQRRAVLATLARDLQATGARRRSDLLKLARLGVDGNVPLPSDLVGRAVVAAYSSGDMVLTERLARPEFERTRGFRVGWDWANAAYLLGDLEGVRICTAQLREVATTSGERLAAALIESQSEYWLAGDFTRALAIIDAALAAEADDDGRGAVQVTRAEVASNRALLHTSAGIPHVGRDGSAEHAAADLSPAQVRAALALSGALYTLGRGDESLAVVGRAMDAFTAIGEAGVALSRRTMLANRAIAHIVNGEIEAALADTDAVVHDAISEQQLSLGYLVASVTQCLAGRPNRAVPLVAKAGGWWARGSAGGLASRWVQAVTAYVAGSNGDVVAAERALAAFDADAHPSRMLDFLAELGRARMHLAAGHPEAARQALLAAIEAMRPTDHVAGMLFCAAELARLGHARDVQPLVEDLVPRTEGRLFATVLQHTRGAVADDAATLAAVVDDYAALGVLPMAIDAAAQGADAARRDGDQRAAARLVQRANDLAARCEGAVPTTAVLVDIGPVALTRREREIGLLAAQGLATKEIAERLFISPRTADNHLGKVYDKLGVRSRVQLTRLLAS